MNVFEYTLMPESEVRGRRWLCTDINTLDGKLVHPLVFKLHRAYRNLRIFYLRSYLEMRVMKDRFEQSEK